ncbi:MAG: UDP-glucose/GDP-mannose dehydrogenase family protein [Gammaproteobacteria bacterium]|nr:UDP-glucose/GDP-mannose dehydrogenase family protein [Gammaproteobacteria bacterium]
MKVAMVGCGYVGLVSGACFAEFGAHVTCTDIDEDRIARLNDGVMPIYEPGLQELIKKNMSENRLNFSNDLPTPVKDADIVFIAVGTPSRHGDGYADLSFVYSAAKEIAVNLRGYTVVVDKSTVPVGTARNVDRIIRQENPSADFDIASNPEFLREGSAISDFMRPDRVVIGVESGRAEATLRDLYRPLNLIEAPILVTGLETAELIKYASNAFLATKISFINEMSTLCEAVNADVHDVAKGMGLDGRINRKFLHPGPGFGGSCFPKDAQALVRMAQEHEVSCRIVEAVIEVNAAQRARMIKKIRDALGGNEAGKIIGILGLTYKPETDDMRDAPALSILRALIEKGAIIQAHDPKGVEQAKALLPEEVRYCDAIYQVFEDAEAVVLLTEWNAYRGLDLGRVRELMKGKVFVDLRNVYEPDQMRDAGFEYFCVGR